MITNNIGQLITNKSPVKTEDKKEIPQLLMFY